VIAAHVVQAQLPPDSSSSARDGSLDQTGTTKIGNLLLNHRFMRPGIVTLTAAVVIAVFLGSILLK
jgi:anaerobic C4-dicarboxylate transporter